MQQQMAQSWVRFRSQLQEQPRLRLGLGLLLLIVGLNLVWAVGDRRDARIPEIQRNLDLQLRLEQALEETNWFERAEAAAQARAAVEARFWRAETPGLARARLESYIDGLVDQHQLTRPRTEYGAPAPIDGHPGLIGIPVRLEALHDADALVGLLESLASHPQPLHVLALSSQSLRPPRMRLELRAYFRIGDELS